MATCRTSVTFLQVFFVAMRTTQMQITTIQITENCLKRAGDFKIILNSVMSVWSLCAALRIHLSPTAKEALSKFSGYQLADRGPVAIKVGTKCEPLIFQAPL